MGEDKYIEAAAKFQTGKRFGEWVVVSALDEGGFGQVYKVEHRNQKGRFAALKAEPNEVEGGSAIKLETLVLNVINADGQKPHIPVVFHSAKHKKFCYMIMTLLGDNLRTLKSMKADKNNKMELMSEGTWSRIGIQCLYSVKLVHDYGYIHRDIKPNNFVIGHRDDANRARIVHILDFGLSRSYAHKKNGKWICRRARGTAEFRGTLRYCSPNVHERKEQGRHDDLFSLFYVLIELHCGLPWQTIKDKEKIEMMKMQMSDKDVTMNMPQEMQSILPSLRNLNCYQRPNYTQFYSALVSVMKRNQATPNDPFDWETSEQVAAVLKARTNTPEWENADAFFKSDPIGINKAPTSKGAAEKSVDNQKSITNTTTEV